MENREFHIGKIISKELKEQGRTKVWLARQVHCDPSNFNKILKRQYIDMDLLRRVSLALDKNLSVEFFEEINSQLKSEREEKDKTAIHNIING